MTADPTILIIDDDVNDRECYRRYLSNYNNIIEATTGEQGLNACCEAEMPDCILLDYILPDTNGLELLSKISTKIKNTCTQVIFMTGHGNEETAVKALKKGANDYLVKTYINKNTLQTTILSALERKQNIIHKAKEDKEIFEKAFYDNLTGLYNKYSFHQSIETIMETSKRYNRIFAVLFIDLNKFKKINDQYNHHTGDLLLQQVGQRIKESVRKEDIAARISGDEFAVALTELRDYHNAGDIAQNILKNINQKILIEDKLFHVTASIGISVYPIDNCQNVQELINCADNAMYVAKRKKPNTCHYSIEHLNSELHCYDKLRTTTMKEVENKSFSIKHRAIYYLCDNTIFGHAAEVVWSNEYLNTICIENIYDGIKKVGLLSKFSYAMLCSYFSSINNPEQTISSNNLQSNLMLKVNTCELVDINYIKVITAALNHTKINPNHIYLEIDSNIIFDYGDLGRNIIKQILSLNINIILNLSSIGRKIIDFLEEHDQINIITISENLVIQDNKKCNKIIIAAIIDTMHKLRKKTLLSNIENQEIANFVETINLDLGHGTFLDSSLIKKTITTDKDNKYLSNNIHK